MNWKDHGHQVNFGSKTLFPLAFVVVTMISIDIETPSFRTMYYIKEMRHEALQDRTGSARRKEE